MTTTVCPVCGAQQAEGLLCHACTSALERELGDVPAIVAELQITLSKQARLELGAPGGLAREREALNRGAMLASDHLNAILTSWARDVSNDQWRPEDIATQTVEAAAYLHAEIVAIRRHPAVRDLVEEIDAATWRGRRAYDRPANRTIIYVGPCPETINAQDCPGSVFAYIPVEDDKPGRMECDAYADHKWSSMQWYRAGKRILDRVNEHKRRDRMQRAPYGEVS